MAAGGLVGDASTAALARLRRYGQAVGLAFQLRDDLHDHDGMVRLVPPPRLRRQVQRLLAQAVRQLEPFETNAALLRELAQWLNDV